MAGGRLPLAVAEGVLKWGRGPGPQHGEAHRVFAWMPVFVEPQDGGGYAWLEHVWKVCDDGSRSLEHVKAVHERRLADLPAGVPPPPCPTTARVPSPSGPRWGYFVNLPTWARDPRPPAPTGAFGAIMERTFSRGYGSGAPRPTGPPSGRGNVGPPGGYVSGGKKVYEPPNT